ncbi:HD domain-containing protein [Paenibacillus sp. NPDC056579]|uniref:HD domain-containing protein n=1 Tax=Paenibacillus sp. NPDC056579 TaxID=3345871 RepID=UPI0036B6781B
MDIIPVQQTFEITEVWEPLYRMRLKAAPFEQELFQSAPLRRLKHLHHFGAGALFSPVTHSRYEHTVGVWALVKHFFPEDRELRAAAIVHDTGHLPFSHSIEQALGLSHHHMTEEMIGSSPLTTILIRHGLSPNRIIGLLNGDSPLTHRSDFLGIDHLDSFLRDTHMAGRGTAHPYELVRSLRFHGHFVDTDEKTAVHLLNAIVNDNLIFLQPQFLAMDDLLSRAVKAYCSEVASDSVITSGDNVYCRASASAAARNIARMTDYELLCLLQSCSAPDIRELLHVLLAEPHRIVLCESHAPGAREVTVRKAYCKQPMVQGLPLRDVNPAAREALDCVSALAGMYYYRIRE